MLKIDLKIKPLSLAVTLALTACGQPPSPQDTPSAATPLPLADIFVDTPGDPVPFMDPSLRPLYDEGRRLMTLARTPKDGLGPTFNADSCASCHQLPVPGGSSPRYRDFFLVYEKRADGALIPRGSNGQSPIRTLYSAAAPYIVPEAEGDLLMARRSTPSGLGVGLFHFVRGEDILALADPEDEDGDGISGRVNYEQGEVGRFGYKSQATSLESFNRGAAFNQMGLTTDPLFYVFPESPEMLDAKQGSLLNITLPPLLGPATAHAQVSAPDAPLTDDDAAPDPELNNEDQLAILIFSTYLGVPPQAPRGGPKDVGPQLFEAIGCATCHLPTLPSTVGALPAYSDLLLHDMGAELADGVIAGLATGSEFRTQPLWGVALHGPWLHDGRADSLEDAILWHGGEAASARARFASLSAEDRGEILAFLESLGGQEGAWAPTPPGEEAGLALFMKDFREENGLGPHFNGDSCRACHQDPAIGGAGGLDVNVILYGERDPESGALLRQGRLPRGALPTQPPMTLPPWANVIEMRSAPSLLGLRDIEAIPEALILAAADPEDGDGDGISGRAHILPDGRLGRLGWKAQIPTLEDFIADAFLNELGLTTPSERSAFTLEDDGDLAPDPEVGGVDVDAITAYINTLSPPAPPESLEGLDLFESLGCARCHTPSLGGIPLYSDLLLHEVAPEGSGLVETHPGAEEREFRTPPLWGVGSTAPYLHDGSASTLEGAILLGHYGEGSVSREAFEALEAGERSRLLGFLKGL